MIIDITNNGIQTTNRDNILQYLIQQFKLVYGDNVYIQEGTEDYNMLSLLADLFNDMGMVAVSVSNGLNLQTATGVQLDNLSTIFYNTLTRYPATYSTVSVTITGDEGVTIMNGQIKDELGGIWSLPSTVTIPNGGTVNVTATYTQPGSYLISAGQISGFNSIVTPTAGWTNVVNYVDAVPGSDVETDAHFRYRIANKAQGQALTTLETLSANLSSNENLPYNTIWENDTGSAKNFSDVSLQAVPAHSICVAVYGTEDNNIIAQTIYNYKGSGVGTYAPNSGTGSTSVSIVNAFGTPQTIEFVKASTKTIPVDISLQKISAVAPNLSDALIDAIKSAVTTQINEKAIGSHLYASNLYSTIAQAITDTVGANLYNISSVEFGSNVTDLQTTYYEKPFTQDTDITITLS